MNNLDKQFNQMRSKLEQVDTSAMEQRIEQQLRQEWHLINNSSQSMNTQPTNTSSASRSLWTKLGYGFGGSALALLALFTAVYVQPDATSSPSSNQLSATGNSNAKPQGTGMGTGTLALGDVDTGLSGGLNVADLDINIPDFEPELDTVDRNSAYEVEAYPYYPVEERSYADDEGNQYFDESVGMTIQVKENILEILDQIKTESTNLSGYVTSVSYTEYSGGIVYLKLPSDTLTVFESYLREIDVNGEIDVTNYNIVNVSDEVVQLDQEIKQLEDIIADNKETLETGELTEVERATLERSNENLEESMTEKQDDRTETVAKYDLVDVTLYVREEPSFWSGNYYQYDTSTYGGKIKYQVGKAINSLIGTSGFLIRFVIWLGTYAIIIAPFWLVIRHFVRKRRARKQQVTTSTPSSGSDTTPHSGLNQ